MSKTEYIQKCMDYVIKKHLEIGGQYDKFRFDATYWMFEGLYERGGERACEDVLQKWNPTPPKKSLRAYA